MNFTKILSLSLLFLSTSLKECSSTKLPIVYHPDYNISFFGLEDLHPFDAHKYGRVYEHLVEQELIESTGFHQPTKVSNEQLRIIHPQNYLNSLNSPRTFAKIIEIPLDAIPQALSTKILAGIKTSMELATGGTILATKLSLETGWAINLGGGYHHAKEAQGSGFCALADIPLAINIVFNENPTFKKALIIDLDAHQGNGHEWIFRNNPKVAIFDIYNEDIYPNDKEAKKAITYDFPVNNGISDTAYLELLAEELPSALDESKPDFIIYNAGTDILASDRLGSMNVSEQGIINRDAFVFAEALKRNIPITMVLSGGYTKQSAGVIGRSIENLITEIVTPEAIALSKLTPTKKPSSKKRTTAPQEKPKSPSLATLAVVGGVTAAGAVAAYFYTTSKTTDLLADEKTNLPVEQQPKATATIK